MTANKMIYKLETIEGAEKFAKKELLEKFADSKIIASKKALIEFENEKDIDEFRTLLASLRITNEQGITRNHTTPRLRTINLFRREWRKEFVPAGLNPALAYVMCMIAELESKDEILDPFCGGGTIPITAKLYFDVKKVIAADISGKAVEITRKNFETAEINKKDYFILQKGIKHLKLKVGSVDKIITNLPFGIRAGVHSQNELTYKFFAEQAKRYLKSDGMLVILTQEKLLLRETFKDFRLIEEIAVNAGGLRPSIFKYKLK